MSTRATFLRLFLVEDNALIRQTLIEHLEDLLPAEVIAWDHSEDGSVQWLQANADHWDVAIVDMFLTQGSGLGIVEQLARRRPYQKVVVLSNYATEAMRERCVSLGVDAVFDKSQELEEFTVYLLAEADEPRHR